MSLIKASGAGEQSTGFYKLLLDQSLKFNDDDAQYLSRTPASAGNRRTFTFSCWVKRSNLGEQAILDAYSDDSNRTRLMFDAGNRFQLFTRLSGADHSLICNAVSRDSSAWYNVVFAVDTTQSTASDRVKIYINGESQTFTGSGFPDQNEDTFINHTVAHSIGSANDSGGREIYYDGYLAEINMIDGTALTAASFGETKNGIWIPKDTSGLTFGTNGFHLTFKDDVVSEGFNTVTYTGTGATQSISGVGFSPSLAWIKGRSTDQHHNLFDVLRSDSDGPRRLYASLTAAEESTVYSGTTNVSSLDADGFTMGNGTSVNESGKTFVGWCWEADTVFSNDASATSIGNIDSSGRTNTAKGFSIIKWTYSTSADNLIAHGLGAVPTWILIKSRTTAYNWDVYHSGLSAASKRLILNSTGAEVAGFFDTTPTSTVFEYNTSAATNGDEMIAYCWTDVSNYSAFGTYSGSGSSGKSVTTGFRPAFLMIKRTDTTGNWEMFDDMRNISNDPVLYANTNGAESAAAGRFTFTSTGFTLDDNGGGRNASGGTYIWMAFADTREARFFADVSSNGNHFTPVNLDYRDSVPDTPTNNFATFNPLDAYAGATTFSEGNLKGVTTSGGTGRQTSTIRPASGKWYAEFYVADASRFAVGIENGKRTNSAQGGNDVNSVIASYNGQTYYNGASTSGYLGSSLSNGDIVQVAMDVDNKLVFIGVNNTWQNSATASEIVAATATNSLGAKVSATAATLFQDDMGIFTEDNSGSAAMASIANFGQDSSFSGNHATANANADGEGHGSFAYAPPTGFLALCSQNLPDPAITDGTEHFNTVTWTATASRHVITGVGFSPDWVWGKKRSNADNHAIVDSVRGPTKEIRSNTTDAEATASNGVESFDSDGFTLVGSGAGSGVWNGNSGHTHVAWNWLAGTAFSNSSGSNGANVDSSGQVNTTAGFSIVSYTATGTAGTIAHGLSQPPELIICKHRDQGSTYWPVYYGDNTDALYLNDTAATTDDANAWNDTSPTSTVFSVGANGGDTNNSSGGATIAYCFHSVVGYSKVGSFVGNGNADGPFVFTGHRPSFLLIKRTDAAGTNWWIFDNKRSTFNVVNDGIITNGSDAEFADNSSLLIDFLSNGFKVRNTYGDLNTSGANHIFLSLADQPAKFSNAR